MKIRMNKSLNHEINKDTKKCERCNIVEINLYHSFSVEKNPCIFRTLKGKLEKQN